MGVVLWEVNLQLSAGGWGKFGGLEKGDGIGNKKTRAGVSSVR
jgi:hypothetical protein